MAITKSKKQQLVSEYRELIDGSPGIILTSFTGVKTNELEAVRRKVRELGGEFRVVKNTLLGLALREVSFPMPEEALSGTTAIGLAGEDVPAIAKAIVDFTRTSELLKLKGALIGGVSYSAAQTQRIAELPALPVMRAQLLGVISAPASRLAGVLASSVRQLANVVHAYAEKEGGAAG